MCDFLIDRLLGPVVAFMCDQLLRPSVEVLGSAPGKLLRRRNNRVDAEHVAEKVLQELEAEETASKVNKISGIWRQRVSSVKDITLGVAGLCSDRQSVCLYLCVYSPLQSVRLNLGSRIPQGRADCTNVAV